MPYREECYPVPGRGVGFDALAHGVVELAVLAVTPARDSGECHKWKRLLSEYLKTGGDNYYTPMFENNKASKPSSNFQELNFFQVNLMFIAHYLSFKLYIDF